MNKKNLLVLTIFLLAGFLAYGNSIGGDFIWDDKPLVAENPVVGHPSSWPHVFGAELYAQSQANYYRPLLTLSFVLNALVAGEAPAGYHVVNILLHVCVGWFLYLFLIRLGISFFFSFAASLVFLVHPLQGQVVSYISGRADSLMAVFVMSALIFYHGALKKNSTSWIACLFFVLALLTKETAIVLPIIIAVLGWLTLGSRGRLFRSLAPFFVIALGYAVMRFTVLNFSFGHPVFSKKGFAIFEIGLLERGGIFAKTLAIYLGSFLAPFGLHMERLISYEKILSAYWAGIALLILLGFWIWHQKKKIAGFTGRHVVFFILWFLIWLFPQSAFIFPKIMAEHFLYLPLAALCFFLALALEGAGHATTKKIALVVLVGYFIILTIQNNAYWADELKFFEKTVALSPHSIRARDSLASGYFAQGRYEDARREYRRLLDLKSEYEGHKGAVVVEASAYYNLALILEREGKLPEAQLFYQKAIDVNPGLEKAHNNLGLLFQKTGEIENARKAFQKAIDADKSFYPAYNNLAQLYAQEGQISEALRLWKTALDIYPGYETAKKNIAIAEDIKKQLN